MKYLKAFLVFVFTLLLTLNFWTLKNFYSTVIQTRPFEESYPLHPTRESHFYEIGTLENQMIRNIVLVGNPLQRGMDFGLFTTALLEEQESQLVDFFEKMFPLRIVRSVFLSALIELFWGAVNTIPFHQQAEMYGVSRNATSKHNSYGDPFLRQIGLHGIHELGQMMVDSGFPSGACTQIGINQNQQGWIIGRNFDFEAGQIFDEKKVVKWVFPEKGLSFVSVIWSGMVGVVSGVNEKGVYIAINASGSDDFSNSGWLATVLLGEALQNSNSAIEAKDFIHSKKSLVSDIFVIADSTSSVAYRLEKTPKKSVDLELKESFVVSNHMESDAFKNDFNNNKRKLSLTTLDRKNRGEEILAQAKLQKSAIGSHDILKILRDKKGSNNTKLYLGNRKSIDALIATHSLIFDSPNNILYVSRGPSLSNKFEGYDLKKSFATRKPVIVDILEQDPEVSPELASQMKMDFLKLRQIQLSVCDQRAATLSSIISIQDSYEYLFEKGLFELNCLKNPLQAKELFSKALASQPPYSFQRLKIQNLIESLNL